MAEEEKQESTETVEEKKPQTTRNVSDDLSDMIGENKMDFVAYGVLLLGLLISFWQPLLGGIIVGIVTAVFYGSEILSVCYRINELIDDYGPFKALIGITAIIFLAINTPYFFVGMIGAVAVKAVIDQRK